MAGPAGATLAAFKEAVTPGPNLGLQFAAQFAVVIGVVIQALIKELHFAALRRVARLRRPC